MMCHIFIQAFEDMSTLMLVMMSASGKTCFLSSKREAFIISSAWAVTSLDLALAVATTGAASMAAVRSRPSSCLLVASKRAVG